MFLNNLHRIPVGLRSADINDQIHLKSAAQETWAVTNMIDIKIMNYINKLFSVGYFSASIPHVNVTDLSVMLVILNDACHFSVSVDSDRMLVERLVWEAPFPVSCPGSRREYPPWAQQLK